MNVTLVYDDLKIIKETVERYFNAAGSKYIRSKLALLYLKALGRQVTDEHRTFLAAIELIHNASLIHDDIIDDAQERRGAPVCRDKRALITGDFLLAAAMQLVSAQHVPMLAKTLENMCLGEFFQLENRFKPLTLEQYLLKTEQKTAGLFAAAFEGCGLPADFARNFGMVFQIRNDLKDKEKDEAAGIYNTPAAPKLLNEYVSKTLCIINHAPDRVKTGNIHPLATLKFLDDNKYKRALEELLTNG